MGIMSPADVWYPATAAEDADDADEEEDDGHIPPPVRFVDSKSWLATANRPARAEAAALGAALLVTEAAAVAADLRARMPAVRESMVAGSCFGILFLFAKAPEASRLLGLLDRRAAIAARSRVSLFPLDGLVDGQTKFWRFHHDEN